jgi:F-type H+-transporting ATPase subunit b
MIDLLPNKTLIVQIAIFLFVYISMNFLVFRPVLRILARRKELTVGAEKSAEELNSKTENLVNQYTQKMEEAQAQGVALKQKFKKEGEDQATEILREAREALDSSLERTRQEVQSQTKEAQLILRKHSRDLSKEIAEKLLGRKVSA